MGIDGLGLVASEREPIEWIAQKSGQNLLSADGRWSIAKVPRRKMGEGIIDYELFELIKEHHWQWRGAASSADWCKRRAEELADG